MSREECQISSEEGQIKSQKTMSLVQNDISIALFLLPTITYEMVHFSDLQIMQIIQTRPLNSQTELLYRQYSRLLKSSGIFLINV